MSQKVIQESHEMRNQHKSSKTSLQTSQVINKYKKQKEDKSQQQSAETNRRPAPPKSSANHL